MSKVLFISLVFSFFATPVFAKVDLNTQQVMDEVGADLDIAESALRIVLKKPASDKLDIQSITDESRVGSAMALLNFEMKHPGHLRGLHGDVDWEQYNTVLQLFKEASTRYSFNFMNSDSRAPQSQKTKSSHKKK